MSQTVNQYLQQYRQEQQYILSQLLLEPVRQAPISNLIDQTIDDVTNNAMRNNLFRGAIPRTLCERARDGEFDRDDDNSLYGDRLFNRIVECMGEFGQGQERVTLRVDQRIMFSHCMGALLPLIYGDKLEANRKRLLRVLGLESIAPEVIILASRRVGKTYFTAMLLAALLICVPEIEVVIFSKSLRQSTKASELVVKFIKMHPLGRRMFVRSNRELVELQGDRAWKTKKLHSFPDRVDVRTSLSLSLSLSLGFGSSRRQRREGCFEKARYVHFSNSYVLSSKVDFLRLEMSQRKKLNPSASHEK